MKIGIVALIPGLVVCLAACAQTNIELTIEGETVLSVESMQDLRDCEELGTVRASRTGFWAGEESRIIKARNKAALQGGNRILPGEVSILGWREYRVFDCKVPGN